MIIHATLDADLQPVELTGAAQLYWQMGEDGAYERSDHYVNAGDLADWDAEALALNRIQAVLVAEPADGQIRTGYTLIVDEGAIAAQASFAAAPPAPRPELPKSTVIARLDAVGKLNAVWAVLNAMPVLFAKWFSPDWPNVYCDDPGMLQVFQAAGLSEQEIATVTA